MHERHLGGEGWKGLRTLKNLRFEKNFFPVNHTFGTVLAYCCKTCYADLDPEGSLRPQRFTEMTPLI